MAHVLSLRPPPPIPKTSQNLHQQSASTLYRVAALTRPNRSWTSLQRNLKCKARFSCLFSDNGKKEQARKALESALGGKKVEFDKWDKEIKNREEAGRGGSSGGGGWFGWGGRFGGFNGDHFWQEARQAGLTILAILVVYLIVAKGDVILAVIFNPLLFALRGTRTGFTFLTSKMTNRLYGSSPTDVAAIPQQEVTTGVSAKERVLGKWGSD